VNIREIVAGDIAQLFEVRVRTRENRITLEQLAHIGITPQSVAEGIDDTLKGWLYEESGRVKGFAMGNRATGEMMVIALLPEIEGRGIGAQLLGNVESWLRESGCVETWLTTEVDSSLRAYGFYLHCNWEDWRVEGDTRYMRKKLVVPD